MSEKRAREPHYEISVWDNTDGTVVKYLPDATGRELDDLRDWYSDRPWLEVVIDREWEEEPTS
jgi:hypothetical protein